MTSPREGLNSLEVQKKREFSSRQNGQIQKQIHVARGADAWMDCWHDFSRKSWIDCWQEFSRKHDNISGIFHDPTTGQILSFRS
mmetsp:Transcript_83557/g.161333  ORF Transcript_83557/g.161333 Transcript_83557/m.161333 type:complete len:84 (-) Transcript_83557:243-494(-)